MADFDLTPDLLAAALGVSLDSLLSVLVGATPVTAEFALRLARYFGNTPEFWLNLQRTFDLALAMKNVRDLDSIRPVSVA
jgi:antitoxin HigA-1